MPRSDEQDYRVFLGSEAFDPKEAAPQARRRAAAARRRRAARAARTDAPARDEAAPEPTIVQFERALNSADIERLRTDYGLGLERFLPNLAFLEALGSETLERLRQDFLVRETMPLDPARKLAPGIGGDVAQFSAALLKEADPAVVEAGLAAVGATDVEIRDDRTAGGHLIARFALDDQARLAEVADLEEVIWIEPVGEDTGDNTEASHTIQTATLDGHPIWDRGIHGEGQVIGVLDRGPPDQGHCFFAGPAPNTPGPGHRKLLAVRNASPPAPLQGHATFVAAIAAGDDRNLPGSSARRGGAWAARLVCGNRLDLNPPISNTLFNELTLAGGAGAFIHSNSWHRNTNPAALPARGAPAVYTVLDSQVDNFTFNNENHLVVGSAGNNGEELGPPGTAKNALCVGAAQADPNEMNLGDGNPGPTADGRRKPDLMAVGCGIQSAMVSTPCGTGQRSPCASSYATPHAAAAATLVRQYFLDGWYPSGEKRAADSLTPTGALLKAVLLNSTQDMTGTGVAGYPSNAEGWGLIRLDRTLFFRGARRRLRVWDQRHAAGLGPGVDFNPYDFDVADETEQLKVTLVWSDPARFFLAFLGPPLVNDLNLEVSAPDGTTYLGNDFTNRVSTPSGNTLDALNTVEMVVVNNPMPGKWRLLVQGIVNQGNPGQGYALVATASLKSKCFVASAVYGDETHPDVRLIRSWRDRSLAGGGARAAGMRALSAAYERVGPPLGEAVRRDPRVARLLRDRVFGPVVAAARRRRARRLQATSDGSRVGPSRGRRE